MNRLLTLVFCAAALTFGGASSCNKPTPNGPNADAGAGNPIVTGAINCAEQGVHNVAINLIDDVATALATGNYVAGLEKLVKQFGEAAVDCAVREVGLTSDAHARLDQLEATKAQRAKAWLAGRPVTLSAGDNDKICEPMVIAGICPFPCAKSSEKGGGAVDGPAVRIGASPSVGPAAHESLPAAPGADYPGVFLSLTAPPPTRGICPFTCAS